MTLSEITLVISSAGSLAGAGPCCMVVFACLEPQLEWQAWLGDRQAPGPLHSFLLSSSLLQVSLHGADSYDDEVYKIA